MRKLVDGKDTYRVPEEQYRQLLGRFDVSKAEQRAYDVAIKEVCICSHYGADCSECCLGKGERSFSLDTNCVVIMRHLAGRIPPSLDFAVTSITWAKRSKAAPVYIRRVREVLLALPRTR